MGTQFRRLRKLSIPKEHIASLSEDRVLMLAAFSFHISEINVFWLIYNSFSLKVTGNSEIDFAIAIHKNTILRVWSSKIFEFLDGLPKKSEDHPLQKFIGDMLEKMKPPRATDGSKDSIASRFRHETAFHLDLGKIKRRMRYISKEATTDFFFDGVEGNSFFPFGEEAIFATSFNQYVAGVPQDEKLAAIESWSNWVISASRALIYLFDDFLSDFVFSDGAVPDWKWIEINLEEEMIARPGEAQIPLFFDVEVTP